MMSIHLRTACIWLFTLLATALGASPAMSLEITGEWTQGQLLIGKVAPGSRVEFLDRTLRVDPDGTFVFGLGRDAPEQVAMLVTDPAGKQQRHEFSVQQRQYHIQRVEGVPARTVNPPPEQLARIRKESALTRAARSKDLERRDFLKDFQWPLVGPITGVYGSQRFYNGEPRTPHYGLDVAAPNGTPVAAPVDGVVTLAYDDMFFSGGTLIIDHGHGVSSTFIHLSRILVEEGQEVRQGDLIAKVGATGRATGPHLDWRINWFNQRLDPQLRVGPMPELDD
ncbi:M23 family metallopeptidase [Gilvimarinus sp. F26214L]|uniref:M23 family metallopeptidase n=1 Tax=Gilvimarinus sp. DZF01 TaxID=3461371 RepID=UPI0040466EE7